MNKEERARLINSLCASIARLTQPEYSQLILVLNAFQGGFGVEDSPARSAAKLVGWAENALGVGLEGLQSILNDLLSREHTPEEGAPKRLTESIRPPDRASKGTGPWLRIDAAFLDEYNTCLDSEELRRYFDGTEPDWGVAQDTRIPMLALGQVILGHVRSNTGNLTFDLFCGATGEGKSTLLYQLAARLGRNDDTAVYWLPPEAERFDPDQAIGLMSAVRTVFIIDHADSHIDRIQTLLRGLHPRIRRSGQSAHEGSIRSAHLIAATRTDRWRARSGHGYHFYCTCKFQSHEHVHFDIDGAIAITKGWAEAGADGLRAFKSVSSERRAKVLLDLVRQARSHHRRSLFGALLFIRFQPKELTSHLHSLLNDLKGQVAELMTIYVAIALVDCATGTGLDERVLARALDLEPSVVKRKLLPTLEDEAAVVSATGGRIPLLQTRHSAIARAVLHIIETAYWDFDMEETLGRLVGAAVRLAREQFIEAFTDLAHCSVRLESRLKGAVELATVRRMAVHAARAAWDADPRPDHLSELISALRRSGDPEGAVTIAAESWSLVTGGDDEHRFLRRLAQVWAHAHANRRDHELALWMDLYSLSDQVVNTKTGKECLLSPLDLRRGLVYAIKSGLSVGYAETDLSPLRPLLGLEVEFPTVDRPHPTERWQPDVAPCQPDDVIAILSRLEQRVPRTRLPAPLANLGPLTFGRFARGYGQQIHALYGGLLRYLPKDATVNDLVNGMESYCQKERGFTPTKEQYQAFVEIADRNNVLLATPTGSGKSMVGLFAHALAFARKKRTVYSAPTKALVNEKFFDLCRLFGARNVGIVTGDVSANRDAPVICCTAEILANQALSGRSSYATVVMDEFHYYGDPERGRAWLLPLVLMRDARFVLMSATVGAPERRRQIVEQQTEATTILVRSDKRPVPLEYEYKHQLLSESIAELREKTLCPAYLVSFNKEEATEMAERVRQMLPNPKDKERNAARRKEMEAILLGERLDTPFGAKLKRLLLEGIGVHHAGLLPRYRRLVERLAVSGKLDFISGTDTLGVGVNMPILTVVFTCLWKFDGTNDRLLTPREFQQLAGRAGRPGMKDERGLVWVQHPEHLVENERKKQREKEKGKRIKPTDTPKRYVPWSETTMNQLRDNPLDDLRTQFELTGDLVLAALHRSDGEETLHKLVRRIGLPEDKEKEAIEKVGQVIERLAESGHITRSLDPITGAPTWNVQGDDKVSTYAYERPEARFLAMALWSLDRDSPTLARQALSLVEATLEDPTAVMRCQSKGEQARLRRELAALPDDPKSAEKQDTLIEQLRNWAPPGSEADLVRSLWREWQTKNAVLAEGDIQPRSIARAMFEGDMTFNEFVRQYNKLDNDEGILLRHLSQTYRSLTRELPPWPYLANNDEIHLIVEWLRALIQHTDPSMIDEWERIEHASRDADVVAEDPAQVAEDPTATRAFRIHVRSEVFGWVKLLARREYDLLAASSKRSAAELKARMELYFRHYKEIRTDADARGPEEFQYDPATGKVRQILLDPEGDREWCIRGTVDRERSREERRTVVLLEDVGPVDDLEA